jgi:dTDP-4-amino-4,6-dideoxygalactose transaminase
VSNLALNGAAPLRTEPFTAWPELDGTELGALERVLKSGTWGNGGSVQREFEREFAKFHGAADGVSVTNGTVSLVLCLRALGIKPGDEVIVPGLTWIATSLAVLETNGVPVFADVDRETLCLDPRAVEAAITRRTVAIIPVHLYRNMADMDALTQIAQRHKLGIIEDCAHAHGGAWRGRGAGTLGDLGSFSFQSSKTMTAGEGGMVFGKPDLLNKVYSQKDCGRVHPDRGQRMFGGNHRMTEWQAAVLLSQLGRLESQMQKREASVAKLRELCVGLPGIRIIADQPQVTRQICYRLVFHYDRREAHGIPLGRFVEAVRAEGVPIERTYPCVYNNALYATDTITWYPYAIKVQRCSVAESIAEETAFTLPHQILLGSQKDLEDVVAVFRKVLANPDEAASLTSRAKSEIKGLMRKFL